MISWQTMFIISIFQLMFELVWNSVAVWLVLTLKFFKRNKKPHLNTFLKTSLLSLIFFPLGSIQYVLQQLLHIFLVGKRGRTKSSLGKNNGTIKIKGQNLLLAAAKSGSPTPALAPGYPGSHSLLFNLLIRHQLTGGFGRLTSCCGSECSQHYCAVQWAAEPR